MHNLMHQAHLIRIISASVQRIKASSCTFSSLSILFLLSSTSSSHLIHKKVNPSALTILNPTTVHPV